MNSTHSVHALVRLLKSPADPPFIPGPYKIEIACLAWSDPSFRAANKGEVIGQWILALLGQAKKMRREGDVNSASDPMADSRYWSLLSSVLTAPPPANARPMKTWLLPLLNRCQLDTIVIDLLSLHSSQVFAPARAALAVLWPLAEKKIGADALGECLRAVFDACACWESVGDDLGWICSAVVGAYRNALANAGHKKKLCNSFLTANLSSWLCATSISPVLASSSSAKQLQDSIYAAGTDTLFSLDALKQPLDTLFAALFSSMSRISSPFPILPRLFASFLSATHRHRSVLFVATTSAVGGKEEVIKKGIEFVGRCWILVQGFASNQGDLDVEMWRSIIDIFEIVGKERLFISCSARGTRITAADSETEGESALSDARDKAVEVLENVGVSSKNHQVEQIVLSLQLLDVLARIEYNFVGSVLERVLSALISIPPTLFHPLITPCSELLVHVLEYHIKTRTVHTYALTLLGSASGSSPSNLWASSTSPMTYTFPLAFHSPTLARALRTSLTPTHITPLATATLKAVESVWRTLEGKVREGEKASKKRKIAGRGERKTEVMLAPAQSFSYTSHVAGTILSNLPTDAYTKGGENCLESLWGEAGKLGWTIVWDCLRERIGTDGEHRAKGGDDKKRRHGVEAEPLPIHFPHPVTSTALRFLYDIRARVSSLLGDRDRLGKSDIETLLDIAQDGATKPELVLEIIRTVFWQMWYIHNYESQKQTEALPIFSVTLDILTAHTSSRSRWSGVSANLTRDDLSLAVLYVLTDRWIDILDALAPKESLERLVSLLLGISLDLSDGDTQERSSEICLQRDHTVVTFRGTLFKLLQNAHFWELHNIRAVFLSSVLSRTAPLASYCFPAPGSDLSLPATSARTQLALACNVYKLLCYVPSEYFTRPVRNELVKRAMVGDVQVSATMVRVSGQRNEADRRGKSEYNTKAPYAEGPDDTAPTEESQNWDLILTFVRGFLQRMTHFLNATGHTTSLAFTNHLLHPPCTSSPSKALVDITHGLIQSLIVNLLRSPEPEAATSISRILTTIIAAKPFSQPSSQETWGHVVRSSTLNLFERLISDFDPASLPDEVKFLLKTLLEALGSALLPYMQQSVEGDMGVDQLHCSRRINAWSRILSLIRWLGIDSRVVSVPYGLKLATSMCRKGSVKLDPITCSSVLGLLFEELWCMPNISHRLHLYILVSLYAVNSGCPDPSQSQHTMDTEVAQAAKKLSVEDFSHLLDVLTEGIGGTGLDADHREHLIHLGKVILRDAPQGTLKVVQNFVTQCISLFADRKAIYGGSSSLKTQCLEFIGRHCSDRPVAIRSSDISNIWSLLNKILSGSPEHDATTTFPIFHHIVTITGALIRLRRDLIVHTLPHLSLVLRRLMLLTRRLRPQLGAKQRKIVTDTFPSWLSATHPLSMDEARSLARLFTSLTAKTVPRTRAQVHPSTSIERQRAESLARPFTKHAIYVLVAYVDAFNDPLCIVNADIRRELEPGLFALCEMVGEHSRDALMVSMLDSGGKTIMKSLWKDYEKQRYVGKG